MNMIELLKMKKKDLKVKREERLKNEKEQLILTLTTAWNEDYLNRYKKILTVATAGALGNNSTEADIKKMILASNRNLFKEDEYDELEKRLNLEKEKTKSKRKV